MLSILLYIETAPEPAFSTTSTTPIEQLIADSLQEEDIERKGKKTRKHKEKAKRKTSETTEEDIGFSFFKTKATKTIRKVDINTSKKESRSEVEAANPTDTLGFSFLPVKDKKTIKKVQKRTVVDSVPESSVKEDLKSLHRIERPSQLLKEPQKDISIGPKSQEKRIEIVNKQTGKVIYIEAKESKKVHSKISYASVASKSFEETLEKIRNEEKEDKRNQQSSLNDENILENKNKEIDETYLDIAPPVTLTTDEEEDSEEISGLLDVLTEHFSSSSDKLKDPVEETEIDESYVRKIKLLDLEFLEQVEDDFIVEGIHELETSKSLKNIEKDLCQIARLNESENINSADSSDASEPFEYTEIQSENSAISEITSFETVDEEDILSEASNQLEINESKEELDTGNGVVTGSEHLEESLENFKMSSGTQTRVLTLNHKEHQESTLFRLNRSWVLQFRLGPSLLGRKVSLYCNYPNTNEQFDRHTYNLLKWTLEEGCNYADDTALLTELTVQISGSFHYYFVFDNE